MIRLHTARVLMLTFLSAGLLATIVYVVRDARKDAPYSRPAAARSPSTPAAVASAARPDQPPTLVKDGERCDDLGRECAPGLACVDGTCRRGRGEGERCGPTEVLGCAPPLECWHGNCRPPCRPLTEGRACDPDWSCCAEGLVCDDGRCTDPVVAEISKAKICETNKDCAEVPDCECVKICDAVKGRCLTPRQAIVHRERQLAGPGKPCMKSCECRPSLVCAEGTCVGASPVALKVGPVAVTSNPPTSPGLADDPVICKDPQLAPILFRLIKQCERTRNKRTEDCDNEEVVADAPLLDALFQRVGVSASTHFPAGSTTVTDAHRFGLALGIDDFSKASTLFIVGRASSPGPDGINNALAVGRARAVEAALRPLLDAATRKQTYVTVMGENNQLYLSSFKGLRMGAIAHSGAVQERLDRILAGATPLASSSRYYLNQSVLLVPIPCPELVRDLIKKVKESPEGGVPAPVPAPVVP